MGVLGPLGNTGAGRRQNETFHFKKKSLLGDLLRVLGNDSLRIPKNIAVFCMEMLTLMCFVGRCWRGLGEYTGVF